jgi:predicted transcriptional regulator
MSVHKTSVYLSAEEIARLATLAERESTSQAEVIRRAIKQYEPERHGDRNFSLVGIAEGPGGSVADLTDEALLEGFGS